METWKKDRVHSLIEWSNGEAKRKFEPNWVVNELVIHQPERDRLRSIARALRKNYLKRKQGLWGGNSVMEDYDDET